MVMMFLNQKPSVNEIIELAMKRLEVEIRFEWCF